MKEPRIQIVSTKDGYKMWHIEKLHVQESFGCSLFNKEISK